MVETWVFVLVVVGAGISGAALALVVAAAWRRDQHVEAVASVADTLPAARTVLPRRSVTASVPTDRWTVPLHRCEQAVRRAALAADAVSSYQARQRLHAVVRRMDAELPSVRSLAELGRSLEADPSGHQEAVSRMYCQLTGAGARFGTVTDGVLQIVVELVDGGDGARTRQQIGKLRQQFPLSPPLSEVLGRSGDEAHSGLSRGRGAAESCHQASTSCATPGAATSSPSWGNDEASPFRSSTAAPDSPASASAPATSHSS